MWDLGVEIWDLGFGIWDFEWQRQNGATETKRSHRDKKGPQKQKGFFLFFYRRQNGAKPDNGATAIFTGGDIG